MGIGTIVILCTVPAMAPTHNTAKWVFTEFTNNTGYQSVALVFFVGMVSVLHMRLSQYFVTYAGFYIYHIRLKLVGLWLATNVEHKLLR